jgi:hypothetical protein
MPNTTITPIGDRGMPRLNVRLLDSPRPDTHSARKDHRREKPRRIRGPRIRDQRAAEQRAWRAAASDQMAA